MCNVLVCIHGPAHYYACIKQFVCLSPEILACGNVSGLTPDWTKAPTLGLPIPGVHTEPRWQPGLKFSLLILAVEQKA